MLEYLDLPTIEEFRVYIQDQLKNNDFFAAAGVFSVLGVLWTSLKKVPLYLWTRIKRKLLYKTTIYETDIFYSYLENWLQHNKTNSYRNTEIKIKYLDNDEGSFRKELKYHQLTDIFFLRRGIHYLKIFKGREKLENASNKENSYLNHFSISGILAKKEIQKWMKEVFKYSVEKEKTEKQRFIFCNDGFGGWFNFSKLNGKSLEHIFIRNKNLIEKDIKEFITSKEWYKKRAIPYKRGYFLYGKPGTGKTSFITAITQKINRDMYILNLGVINSDSNLNKLFGRLKPDSVLVIEDIDAYFTKDREKEKSSFRINFSTLLNCLDGAFSKEGIITFFTTNHPERLDPALIREGRMDYHFEVNYPQKDQIEEYISVFYEKNSIVTDLPQKNNNTPMVKIQEICIKNKDNMNNAIIDIKNTLNMTSCQV